MHMTSFLSQSCVRNPSLLHIRSVTSGNRRTVSLTNSKVLSLVFCSDMGLIMKEKPALGIQYPAVFLQPHMVHNVSAARAFHFVSPSTLGTKPLLSQNALPCYSKLLVQNLSQGVSNQHQVH